MTMPRASTAIASMRTARTTSTAAPADPGRWAARLTACATMAAASPPTRILGSDTEADELSDVARLDFEEILACREPRERQFDLLNVGRTGGSNLQLAHGLAASTQQ